MNLNKLFDLQKDLNYRLVEGHDLDEYVLSQRKALGLHVQIAKLANSTNCFKFWNKKDSEDRKVVLENYLCSLFFILSIGIDKCYTDININPRHSEYCLTDQFLTLYIDINDLVITSSKDHYKTIFDDFLSLGLSLGFSDEEIENTYIETMTNLDKIK